MPRSAKTVSIRQLQAAVKTALEAAQKEHPGLKIDLAATEGVTVSLPVYVRFPSIAGLPPFPGPERDLQGLVAFNDAFVASLAGNKDISALGIDGKFEPAIYLSRGKITLGFVPADVSLTQ